MDPLTLTLVFCAAVGWFVRNWWEDGVAQWRAEPGTTPVSPRIARRETRQRIALDLEAETGQPTVRRAVAGRVATRIADRPQRSFLRDTREYLAERWADALSDSLANSRATRDGEGPDAPPALVARPCQNVCGRLVTYDGLCGPCERDAGGAAPTPESYVDDEQDAEVVDAGDSETPEPAPVWLCATCRQRPVASRGVHCDGCLGADRAHATAAAPVRRCGTCETPLYSHETGPNCGPCAAPGDDLDDDPDEPPGSVPACIHCGSRPAAPGKYFHCATCSAHIDDLLASGESCTDRSHGDPWCRACHAQHVPDFGGQCPTCTPQTPEPTPAPDTHQEGPTPVTAPAEIISGDIGSPREALAFCEANQAVVQAAIEGLTTVIATLSAKGAGQEFLDLFGTTIDALDAAACAVDGARDIYVSHVRTQADLLGNPDLRDTLIGYLDAARA